jgi:uncharacterized protein (TIGR03083 family)
MNAWNFMDYASKGNLLDAVRRESTEFFALAEDPTWWRAPTGAGDWQVRDVFGHLIDTTETYFVGFDAAHGDGQPPESVPLTDMAIHVDVGARRFRDLKREDAIERLRVALAKMLEIEDALGEEEWASPVPHKYMGPLPSFFYPVFQLVDYAVHSWDIREGTGRAHGLESRSADLLVPLCHVLWTATPLVEPDTEVMEVGIRITSGGNAGDTKYTVTPEGVTGSPDPIDDLPVVIEFDPASFVLTAYGRTNAGTIHGDRALAHRFLNSFYRI